MEIIIERLSNKVKEIGMIGYRYLLRSPCVCCVKHEVSWW